MQVGIDIVEIARFGDICADPKKLARLFTADEIAYCQQYQNCAEHIAGTFAAKEAVSKALKTGFNAQVTPQNIEILRKDHAPYVHLKDAARDHFTQSGFTQIDLSIAHDRTTATAICIIA